MCVSARDVRYEYVNQGQIWEAREERRAEEKGVLAKLTIAKNTGWKTSKLLYPFSYFRLAENPRQHTRTSCPLICLVCRWWHVPSTSTDFPPPNRELLMKSASSNYAGR